MEIIARHKTKGTEYIFAEFGGVKNSVVNVSTERGWPQIWIVDAKDVEFLEKSEKSRKQKLVEKIEIIINRHSPIENFEVKEKCAQEIAELFY